MAVIVPILGDSAGLRKAIRQADKAFGELGDSVKSVGIKVAAGFTAVAAFAGKAVMAAVEDQKAQALLEQQIMRTTGASQAQAAAVGEFIDKTQLATGVVDDQLRPALSNMVRITGDVEKAQSLLGLALDVSAGSGKDLGAVSIALSRAYMGNFSSLQKLGVPLDENIKKSKDFGAVTDKLTQMFGGAAAAQAETFSGRLQRLQIAFSEIVEQVGYYLLPVLDRLLGFIQSTVLPFVQRLTDAFGDGGLRGVLSLLGGEIMERIENMNGLATVLFAVAGAVGAIVIALKVYKTIQLAVNAVTAVWNVLLAANPVGLIVLAVVALIGALAALYVRFEGVRKVVNVVINAIVGYLEFMTNMWIKAINYIIDRINGLSGVFSKIGVDIPKIAKVGEVSFGRIGDAAERSAKRIGYSFERVVKTESARWSGLAATFQKTTGALDGLEGVGGGASKQVETAAEKLKKYIDALKGVTQAERGLRDARKQTQEANVALIAATEKLTKVQDKFNRAIAGYGAESAEGKKAQTQFAKAQREVERAGYRVEQANFAVLDAEKELAALRLDPDTSPQKIREAEIALAEAKLSVRDATDDQVNSTEELRREEQRLDEVINGVKEGTESYNTLLDELNEAKKNQAEATDRVTMALEKERDAVDAVREAEEKLQAVRRAVGAAIAAQGDAKTATTAATAVVTKQTPTGVVTPTKTATASVAQVAAATGFSTELIGAIAAGAARPEEAARVINVTVNAGLGTDGQSVAKEIVDTLKDYERLNGYIPITSQYALAL